MEESLRVKRCLKQTIGRLELEPERPEDDPPERKARRTPEERQKAGTPDEFRAWLMQFDHNKDGRISKAELTNALCNANKRFVSWKAFRGIIHGDVNGDGFIDENEIDNLAAYAQTSWGIKIVE